MKPKRFFGDNLQITKKACDELKQKKAAGSNEIDIFLNGKGIWSQGSDSSEDAKVNCCDSFDIFSDEVKSNRCATMSEDMPTFSQTNNHASLSSLDYVSPNTKFSPSLFTLPQNLHKSPTPQSNSYLSLSSSPFSSSVSSSPVSSVSSSQLLSFSTPTPISSHNSYLLVEDSPDLISRENLLSADRTPRSQFNIHDIKSPLCDKIGRRTNLFSPLIRLKNVVNLNEPPKKRKKQAGASEISEAKIDTNDFNINENSDRNGKRLKINTKQSVLFFSTKKERESRNITSKYSKIQNAEVSSFDSKIYFGVCDVPNMDAKRQITRSRRKRFPTVRKRNETEFQSLIHYPSFHLKGDMCDDYPKVPLPKVFRRERREKMFIGMTFAVSGISKNSEYFKNLHPDTPSIKNYNIYDKLSPFQVLCLLIERGGGKVIHRNEDIVELCTNENVTELNDENCCAQNKETSFENVVSPQIEDKESENQTPQKRVRKIATKLLITPRLFLISDQPHLTPKYLCSLVSTVQLLHYNWVLHSVEEKCLLPYKPYILPTVILNNRPYFALYSEAIRNLFRGFTFFISGSEKFTQFWKYFIDKLGATLVNNLTDKCGTKNLYCLCEQSKDTKACSPSFQSVTIEWILSCLVQQKVIKL